jgi:type IV pilus assembly protein PilC
LSDHFTSGPPSGSCASAGTYTIRADLVLEMIEVGEASGALTPMVGSVAEFHEDDVNNKIKNLVALIEPAILIFMAILIAFILVALYLPMFSLSVGGAGQG